MLERAPILNFFELFQIVTELEWTDSRVDVANIGGPVIYQLEIEMSDREKRCLKINLRT